MKADNVPHHRAYMAWASTFLFAFIVAVAALAWTHAGPKPDKAIVAAIGTLFVIAYGSCVYDLSPMKL